MYRKNNPWVSLVALLLLVLIFVLSCTGCAVEAAAKTETTPRFTVENAGNGCKIITDNETGMQYLYYFHSYNSYKGGSGLVKLEG